MSTRHFVFAALASAALSFASLTANAETSADTTGARNRGLIDLWASGQPAFGQYVTQHTQQQGETGAKKLPAYTVKTGRDLAENPLLDFAFLSLEQHWDEKAAADVARGIRSSGANSALPLLVRIPPISADGVDAARARVKKALALGADGVVIPHVMSVEEAHAAVSFFENVNVWSPDNPGGDVVAMLIIEDPPVFDDLEEISTIPGYSALVCGIGSLTSALGGDRQAAEVINLQVLAQSQRVGMPNLTTVDAASVAQRVEQGFLALLAYGTKSDETFRLGRLAAGR